MDSYVHNLTKESDYSAFPYCIKFQFYDSLPYIDMLIGCVRCAEEEIEDRWEKRVSEKKAKDKELVE